MLFSSQSKLVLPQTPSLDEQPLKETETTRLQQATEEECAPFFVDLSSLSKGQRDHLVQVGLLPVVSTGDGNNPNDDDDDDHDESTMAKSVRLLREKHCQYLQQVWNKPLKAPFVSLDSSRPWILYWCLHGYDLLGDTEKKKLSITNEQGRHMIETMRDCWQSYYTTDAPSIVSEKGTKNSLYFARHKEDEDGHVGINQIEPYQYYCGGFGGGPGQLAHAATTYAAVLALCVLATDDDDDEMIKSQAQKETHYSVLARAFLQEIRIPLYRWMVSLQQPFTGGYRMHHDGEVDVRATYTIITCAKLLQLLAPFDGILQRPKVIDFVVSCQTYEGGMGGEPFSEAHGGYTFCGVAALQLMEALRGQTNGSHRQLDVSALIGWLSRRQMAFEGGFSGRANKLVDGCYSFWQGGAMAIASSCTSGVDVHDPWLHNYLQQKQNKARNTDASDEFGNNDLPFSLLFDVTMLERYILLCAQEVHGGLRDKPSKPRDFYHTCYNLSGLSVAQHFSNKLEDPPYGNEYQTCLAKTHPCYNIRIDRVATMLNSQWTTP